MFNIFKRKPKMKLPTHKSLDGRILSRLITGHILTGLSTLQSCKTMRLSANIHRLRTISHINISSNRISFKTSDHGRKANVAEYWLDGKELARMRSQFGESALADLVANVREFEARP